MNAVNAVVRPMNAEEYPLLEDFLCEAVFQMPGNKPAPKNIIEAPELRVYIQDLGRRRDDFCLCAESEGRVIGAAWARLSTGFGRIDDQTPELAVSVLKAHRGRGVGSALLRALIARLRRAGFAQVSLSVQKANPAVRLYRRLGFCVACEQEGELVMILPLSRLKETRINPASS
ncbi:GNAT family N-acetyltransferase [uncultured Mailhella sp.]|uniref:GNAT family N-acetyltransferase n=1 Tax=uncultured Mailhella sp. TaxID=1981031 RepID=UPI00320B48AD